MGWLFGGMPEAALDPRRVGWFTGGAERVAQSSTLFVNGLFHGVAFFEEFRRLPSFREQIRLAGGRTEAKLLDVEGL